MTKPTPKPTAAAPAALATNVLLQPGLAALPAGQDYTVDVLLRLQAPARPADAAPVARQPQALALVIDKSGSMEGVPLEEAKRCARMVVERLHPDDTVAIVEFDDTVRRLWPATPRGDGAAQMAAIDAIECGSSTDLHAGWQNGGQALADVAGQGMKRVILLSDGGANHGETDPTTISAACARMSAAGISTSTYGLGLHFNEELMVQMARAGGGNSYYGDKAEDLMEPFERELDLLDHLCLRDLRLTVTAPDGVSVQMLNDLPAAGAGWRLPDLAWSAEAWAVLRVTVPASAQRAPGERVPVLRVALSALDAEGTPLDLEKVGLALPVVSPEAHAALPVDALVHRRVSELAVARELLRMREAARNDDWDAVESLLADAIRRFADNEWVQSVLESMKRLAAQREQRRLMKEASYSASSMNLRLSAHDETVHYSMQEENLKVASYLRRKREQGKAQ